MGGRERERASERERARARARERKGESQAEGDREEKNLPLEINKYTSIYALYCVLHSKKKIEAELERGNSVGLIVGGIEEVLEGGPQHQELQASYTTSLRPHTHVA